MSLADPEGGPLSPPLKNHKNLGFLSNTGPDLMKNHKATKPAFNVGPLSATSETPFKSHRHSVRSLALNIVMKPGPTVELRRLNPSLFMLLKVE